MLQRRSLPALESQQTVLAAFAIMDGMASYVAMPTLLRRVIPCGTCILTHMVSYAVTKRFGVGTL